MTDALVCRACGRSNEADARFCSGCGSRLAAGGAAPREARKVITALFADVVGSTALGERLDPEDLQTVVGEGVARVVRAAEELGGHVDRVVGDGALVLFGAPVAHEDDAERAVLAGLRVLETLAEYAREVDEGWGIEGFAVRVGIETGPAVLAPLGGTEPIEFGAAGDVLNTAARLEAAAEPGTMLVGPHTFRLTEAAFEWGQSVSLDLKGKTEAVVAHRPTRPRPAGARRLPEQHQVPLTGRQRELEILQLALHELHAGRGGVLLVSGEPGLGKTRLLAELRARAGSASPGSRKPLWLEGRCVSYGQHLPYLPFQLLLRAWLGASPEQGETETATLLDSRLAALVGERAGELRPFLGPVLGLTPRPEDAARLAGLQPQDAQRRTAVAFAELVERLTKEGPVVLALDDLHWADATSVGLAERLLRLSELAPVLLVLVARPERDHPSWRLGRRAVGDLGPRAQEIELGALGGDADRELLAALVGGATLPPEFERRVLDRAEGNPLYLEELVRSLIDAGALVPENGGWRFERDVEVEVPETVEKVILARVDVLSPVARELLCAASVIGRRFTRRVLEAVAGDASALRELQGAGLVREGRRWPENEYRFKHHLIQETTYRSMLKRRRIELHRRAAGALERIFHGRVDEWLGVLAHHWGAAGEHERALEYHVRAGQRAWGIAAVQEALDHYSAAVEAAGAGGLGAADERVRAALFKRGLTRILAGQPEGCYEDLVAVLEAARASGDRQTEMEALADLALYRYGGYSNAIGLAEKALEIARSLDARREQVRALARLAILDSNRLKLDRALAEGREALAIARAGGEEEVLAWALDGLKLAELKLGDFESMEAHCTELIRINQRRDDPIMLKWVMLESTFAMLGRGELGEALTRAEEALALNRQLGDRHGEPLFLDTLCWVERSRGNYGRALQLGRDASAHATELELGEWQGWTAATLGWTLLDLRAADLAAAVLTGGLEAARGMEASGEALRCAALLAWARWLQGREEAALALADEATQRLAEVVTPADSAWLFGAHAQLALARTRAAAGDPAAAAAIAEPLRKAAARAGWREVAAAAELVLAQCEEASGRADEAVRLLQGTLDTPGDAVTSWEAGLALARLSADPEAERHAAVARALIEDVLAGLGDDPAAASLAALLPRAAAGYDPSRPPAA